MGDKSEKDEIEDTETMKIKDDRDKLAEEPKSKEEQIVEVNLNSTDIQGSDVQKSDISSPIAIISTEKKYEEENATEIKGANDELKDNQQKIEDKQEEKNDKLTKDEKDMKDLETEGDLKEKEDSSKMDIVENLKTDVSNAELSMEDKNETKEDDDSKVQKTISKKLEADDKIDFSAEVKLISSIENINEKTLIESKEDDAESEASPQTKDDSKKEDSPVKFDSLVSMAEVIVEKKEMINLESAQKNLVKEDETDSSAKFSNAEVAQIESAIEKSSLKTEKEEKEMEPVGLRQEDNCLKDSQEMKKHSLKVRKMML